jgi:hypothetical protein
MTQHKVQKVLLLVLLGKMFLQILYAHCVA